jgi:hypothetical protein
MFKCARSLKHLGIWHYISNKFNGTPSLFETSLRTYWWIFTDILTRVNALIFRVKQIQSRSTRFDMAEDLNLQQNRLRTSTARSNVVFSKLSRMLLEIFSFITNIYIYSYSLLNSYFTSLLWNSCNSKRIIKYHLLACFFSIRKEWVSWRPKSQWVYGLRLKFAYEIGNSPAHTKYKARISSLFVRKWIIFPPVILWTKIYFLVPYIRNNRKE